MSRRLLWLGIALSVLAAVLPGGMNVAAASETASPNPLRVPSLRTLPAKIEPQVLHTLQSGKTARVLLFMAEQADVSAAKNLRTKSAKGAFVFNTLRATAQRTQAAVRALLDRRGLRYRAFYVANVIAVDALDANTAALLAARSDVGRITADPDVKLNEPAPRAPSPQAAVGIQWGILKINADKLWQLGFKGKSIVVANQDTGVQWNHPALIQHYRGYKRKTGQVIHSYSWWDAIHGAIAGGNNACGYNSPEPCDDFGHGTHTMGTLAGGVDVHQIGVAPKARWIACRDMDNGTGRPSTYIECFQFFLAPWDEHGNNPDPAQAPDVVSNSWGCPPSELCSPDSLELATENVRAAGIFVSVSAGNAGSECSTVSDPSAIYDASTTVGATDSGDNLADFSSRGPVTVDNSNRRKPDLSAPGVNVWSAFPPNRYVKLSGTSMAAPHLAGAVALLWQAKPALRGDVDATENALFASADPNVHLLNNQNCGGTAPTDIPNNLFGYGRLDVWKAYRSVP